MDGNLVMYYYHIENQYSGTTYLGKQLWLESIRYTGNAKTGETGIYTVFFSGEHCTETIRTRGDETTPPEDDCQCPDMFLKIHKYKTVEGSQKPLVGIQFDLRDNTTDSENTYSTDGHGDVTIPILDCNHEFTLNEWFYSGYCNILRDFQFRLVKEDGICRFEIINYGNQPEAINFNNNNSHYLMLDIVNYPCTPVVHAGDSIYSARPQLPEDAYACLTQCDCDEEYPEDLRTDARWGFLHSGKNKLRRILIYSGDSLARSYSFCYGADVFGRAQLQKIRQWGADCSGESWDHEFSYYDDIEGACLVNNNGETVMDSVSVSEQQEQIKNVAALRLIMSSAVTYPGKLSSNRTWSIGMGGGVNVGVGGNTMSREVSLAYSMQASMDYGKGLTTLQDVTGDGLPDMVYYQHGNTYYRPQMRNANGVFFGPEEELADVKNFLKSHTLSISHGPSINALVHGGLNFTHSKQTTNTYFSDIDGDGRLDIVQDGKVNSILPRYEAPVLTIDSSCTGPSLIKGNTLPPIGEISMPEDMYYEEEKEEDDIPHYDLVRVWQVPADAGGDRKYKIYAPAFLLEDSTVQTSNDTILLSIEYMDSDTHYLIASGELVYGDTLWDDTLQVSSIKKSGVLFFRARTANSTVTGQLLQWDPQVMYFRTFADVYGQCQPYAEKASESQVLASDGQFHCPFQGLLHVTSHDTVGPFIDSVNYTLHKNGVEMYRFVGYRGMVSLQIDTTLQVEEEDVLSFKAEASSHVNFAKNQWRPYLYYEYVKDSSLFTGDTVVSMIQTDTLQTTPLKVDTLHLLSFYPLPFYKA
ncbi:MAG: VCBS repeat-containing protein, partial [Bacteroidales bacterium]|nr:VCBS repeat-containing protein [Bacteroidales bacterium]